MISRLHSQPINNPWTKTLYYEFYYVRVVDGDTNKESVASQNLNLKNGAKGGNFKFPNAASRTRGTEREDPSDRRSASEHTLP